MTERQERIALALFALAVAAMVILVFTGKVRADEIACPPNAKSCKVLTLTPEEQDMLLRDKGILQTAVQARPLDLGALIQYFVSRIEQAPAGKVVEPPKEAKPAEKPAEKK